MAVVCIVPQNKQSSTLLRGGRIEIQDMANETEGFRAEGDEYHGSRPAAAEQEAKIDSSACSRIVGE
jgi:hypothetical protein